MGSGIAISFWKGLLALCFFTAAFSGSGPLFGAHAIGGKGYWSTDGRKIVDAEGTEVYFSGVSWTGFDSPDDIVHGIWNNFESALSLVEHIKLMRELGINLIRITLAGSNLKNTLALPKETAFDPIKNPELVGKTSLQILDTIVATAKEQDIRILLGYHRIQAGDKPEQGLWYDDTTNVTSWIAMLKMIAERYVNESTVIGISPFNEPHRNAVTGVAPVWAEAGVEPEVNWRDAVIEAGNAIHSVNPDLLIVVQGLDNGTWWGENLTGARKLPIKLTIPNKVVYEVHDYGPMTAAEGAVTPAAQTRPWFQVPNYPDNLNDFWDLNFGYLLDEDLAPVVIGEWGSFMDVDKPTWPAEKQWLDTIAKYIDTKNISWIYFQWTANSVDTGGILDKDYSTPITKKVDFLKPLLYPGFCTGALECNLTTSDITKSTPNITTGTPSITTASPPRRIYGDQLAIPPEFASNASKSRVGGGTLLLLIAAAMSLWQSHSLLLAC